MSEMLLTIEQAAERLQLHGDTVRKQLQRGALRGIKRGRVWRVPESALTESSAPQRSRWAKDAERVAGVYADDLATDGELTAVTTAGGDFHAPSGKDGQ